MEEESKDLRRGKLTTITTVTRDYSLHVLVVVIHNEQVNFR